MSEETKVSFARIQAARDLIADTVRETPVWPLPSLLAASGEPVLLKCEQLQLTGSFKIRGALNFVRRLSAANAERGLITASAGNHAQGVAFAGAASGIPVDVVMPESAPLAKVAANRDLGANVILYGESLEEARGHAVALARAGGLVLVPPFDDDDVISGQGTLGLEILDQVPDVEEVLVPAGGGGLLAGVATAVKALRPHARVVGVQARAMDGIRQSLEAGRPVSVKPERTLADGVAVGGPSERTFSLIEQHVDTVVSVGEEAIAHAIVLLLERAKLVAEGAGALAVAALESGFYKPHGRTVAVVSGGNIDINLMGTIVRHGLVEAGRYQRLTIEVADTPGELAFVAGSIAELGANVLEVEHVREAAHLPVGVALLDLVVEVKGAEHFRAVVKDLRRRGVTGREPGRLISPSARKRHLQG